MKIEVSRTYVKFIREQGDPKFYGVREAKGESNLFHFIKKQLVSCHPDLPSNFPKDWVKKRMWHDGHMVDSMQQYLRTRKPIGKADDGTPLHLCLHNAQWAIRGAEANWNEGGVRLTMEVITICTPELTLRNPDAIAAQSRRVWEQIGQESGIA